LLSTLRRTLIKKLQKVFWIYWTDNFIVVAGSEPKKAEPAIPCSCIPITYDNCWRVADFREKNCISEYQAKLCRKELGFFAESYGKVVGSIWATVNNGSAPTIVRMYMPLMHKEALIHDIVTDPKHRGMGVGPFMVEKLVSDLFAVHGAVRIIVDVNVRNRSSLRMMEKIGLEVKEQMLYISALGRLVLQKTLRAYS